MAAAAAVIALVALVAATAGCGVSSDVSRELGARCDQLDECDDRCLGGARFPGGFCSASCDADSDCPEGASCADIDGGVCLFACGDAGDCDFLGTDWECLAEDARGGGEVMVCIGSR
jgi:hypothetical protein